MLIVMGQRQIYITTEDEQILFAEAKEKGVNPDKLIQGIVHEHCEMHRRVMVRLREVT